MAFVLVPGCLERTLLHKRDKRNRRERLLSLLLYSIFPYDLDIFNLSVFREVFLDLTLLDLVWKLRYPDCVILAIASSLHFWLLNSRSRLRYNRPSQFTFPLIGEVSSNFPSLQALFDLSDLGVYFFELVE